MTEKEKTGNESGAAVSALPPETQRFLGIGGADVPSSVPPANDAEASQLPAIDTDAGADEEEKREETRRMRRAVAAASARRLVRTDPATLTDVGKRALYRSVTKGIFGVDDAAGVFFDRSGNVDANLAKLRKFVDGDLNAVKTPEQTAWESIDPADEEARYRAAEAGLKSGAKSRMAWKGETAGGRGPGFWRMLWSGMQTAAAQEQGFFGDGMMDAAIADNAETVRRTNYESLTDEEKAKWRKATIAEYERQLAKASPVAAFLSATHDMTDTAAGLLARSFETGDVDRDELKALSDAEQEKVLTALALMRGDQSKGKILFVPTDFDDNTRANRFQLMLYGLQQGFIDDFANIGSWGKAAWQQAYAKCVYDEKERRDYLRRIDLDARVKAALKQPLPDADTFAGAMFQGVTENAHWFVPYGAITKGGRVVKAAKGALKIAKEAGKNVAMAEKAVATAKDVETAVRFGLGAEGAARQIAAVERYTELLRTAQSAAAHAAEAAKGARGAWLKGRALQSLGRLSAYSSFAQEFIDNADADGLSREDSVPTAAFVGVINAMVERLYMPGMESSLNPAEIKSLMWKSAVEAWRHERMAGLRKWVGNYVRRNAVESAKVFATEGLVEEELQQLDTEIGKALDRRRKELREAGRGDLADLAGDLWERMRNAEGSDVAGTFGKAWAIYVDTAAEVLPSSVGFGLGTVPLRKAKQHISNRWGRGRQNANGDLGVAYVIDAERRARREIAAWWEAEGEEGRRPDGVATPNDALAAARRAFREAREGGGVELMQQIADAAGVDLKTAEAVHDALQAEAEFELVSPRVRMEVNLANPVAEVSEKDVKAILPGYVDGSFLADREHGLYSARLKLDSGEEKTLVYRIGDMSQWASDSLTPEGLAEGGEIAASYEARRAAEGAEEMRPWSQLTEEERYDFGLKRINGISAGGGGVFQFVTEGGRTATVSADDVISLASGRLADVGYGARATGATLRHETFHALWRFMKEAISPEDKAALYSHFPHLDPKAESDKDLDEAMAQEFERYASGEYVPQQVRGRIETWTGWAMEKLGGLLNALGFGAGDGPRRADGSRFTLQGFYDAVLAGRLGSGQLGVELRDTSAPSAQGGEEGKAEDRKPEGIAVPPTPGNKADESSGGNEKLVHPKSAKTQAQNATVDENGVAATKLVHTAENPADASTPNQRYYRVGLPNSNVKLVGRLEVRDVETGLVTSTDADYHDRGNQNRDDRSEESRALVEKIGANPDPLQVGTVQPIANNGIVWLLNNSNVIIGNHRVNGVRLGYAKGTASELEKFVREDAAKRGIEIGEDVKKPLLVFVLERIESPDGKADVHEVVRLANESQNRGFNVREQAGNDAKILLDNNLLPRMAFRADGRIDETKSGDAIGKFRQETGAQGMIAEDGSLTEDGQTRIQNAALAVLLGGEGTGALLNKIMSNAGRLDMQNELRALMKMTPELMALSEDKSAYDLRAPLAEALQLFTEWRDKDESARVEKGKTRHDWRETAKDGHRVRGVSWEAFMSQGDMFRQPSDEARILGDLFARAEAERSFDREDVESAVGKKRAIDLITGYLTDYIENVRAVNTETEDMFGSAPASRAEVMAAQRVNPAGGVRFSVDPAKVRPATKEEYDAALSAWGEMKIDTDNVESAGWIFPDGRVLKPKMQTTPYGTFAHHDSLFAFLERPERTSDDEKFEYGYADSLAGGAVRLNLGNGGIEIMRLPTAEQLDTLYDALDAGYKLMEDDGEDVLRVDVDRDNGAVAFTAQYRRGTSARRIMDDLRGWFDDAKVPAAAADVRYSVSRDLQDAMRKRELLESIPVSRQGGARFSINPNLRDDIDAALTKDAQGHYKKSGGSGVRFADSFRMLDFLGVVADGVFTTADRVRKMHFRHFLEPDQIASIPQLCDRPAAVFVDIDGAGSIVILTDARAPFETGSAEKPVMVLLRPEKGGTGEFLASAYSRSPANEKAYVSWKDKLRYFDKNIFAGLNLEGETDSQLEPQASGDDVLTPDEFSEWSTTRSIANPADESKRRRASFDFGDAYPQLNHLHDEDLVAAVLGVRLALGKTSEERFGKVTKATAFGLHLRTVERLLRSVKPDLDRGQMAHEVYQTSRRAAKLARSLREDLDRGVSESTILRHLPDTMRGTFGEEMKSQSLRGIRLGRFGESAEDRLEARAREIEAAATRNVTGIELSTMEAAWGIDLTATLLAMPPQPTDGEEDGGMAAAEGTGGEDGGEDAQGAADEETRKEVDEKVRKAVQRIVESTAVQANLGEMNRKHAREAAGRDAEREAEMASEDGAGDGGASFAEGGGDIVAEAVAKEGVNVNSPLHFALLVKEMVRARWCQEHGLGQNAEPWHNAVAKQFLRRSAANIYTRLGRDLCYSAGRETVMRHCASLENVPTVDGIVSEMEFIGRVIARWRIRDSQKRQCEALDGYLQEKFGAKGRFRPGTLLVERVKEATDAAKERGEPELHGVSAEAQLMAKYMRHAMWLSVEGAEREAAEIRRDLAAATVEFSENDSDVEQSRVMADAVRKLNILREWGALQYRTPAEIEAAAEWWRKFYEGESDAIVGEWEKREERTTGIAAAFARGVRNPNRKHSRTKRTGADVANEYVQANYGGFMHLLRDLMRFADDATRKECEPYLQWLELEIQKCGTRAATEKRKNGESFRKAVEAIYGKRWEKVVAELTEEDETFEKFMGEDDNGVKVAPTRGRAMQLLASLVQIGRRVEVPDEENPGETKNVWVGGYHDNIVKHKREGQADELKKLLSPQDLKLIAWMRRWYEQNRAGLSGVSQRLFGIGVYAETGNYMPVKMLLDPQGLEKADGVGWSIFPRSLTPRVKNERDFDTSADILEMWGARMDEAAQWKTHAALGLELRGIFGRAEFQKAVRASHGAAANRLVLGYITDILSGHGISDGTGVKSFLDSARGWAAVGALGGNIGVMLKQMTSIPAFGFEIGAFRTATHFVSAFTPAGIAAMQRLIDSDERKNRWTGGNTEAVANAMRVKSPNALKRYLLASMITNKVGDIVPALVIGQGIYRDALERGMSDEDAMAYTWMLVERTQQSSRVENRAAFQRRNSIGNAIYQFLSTQQQYLNYEVRAVRAVLADKTNLRKWGDLANAAVLNHFVLSSLYYWMGQLYRALLGQEPPEDQLKDWVVGMILGPYGALYGVGITTTDAVNNWVKGYQFGKDNAVPSLSWLGSVIVRDPVRLVHDAFDRKKKWDDITDDLGRWCADFNATFRDLRKIYEFRVKNRDPMHFQLLDDGRKRRKRKKR